MTVKQFDNIASELFGRVLVPVRFSNARSRFCTFYRQVSEEIYHVVVPDPGSRGVWYDVKVFPVSPSIDPTFRSRFPDDLAIPTDSWSYLSEEGVGLTQRTFNCKHEENMRQRFEMTVRPLLLEKALPYFDNIQTVEEMIPWIKSRLFLGLALHHVGRFNEAQPILLAEKERLSQLDLSDRNVMTYLRRVNELLA